MDCLDFGIKYLLYRYDELDAFEADEFSAHLEECKACRSRYNQVRLIMQTFDEIDEPVQDEVAVSRTRDRFLKSLTTLRIPWSVQKWGALQTAFRVAAGIVIIAGFFVLVMAGRNDGMFEYGFDLTGNGAYSLTMDSNISTPATEYSEWIATSWESGTSPLTADNGEPGLIEQQIEVLDQMLAGRY